MNTAGSYIYYTLSIDINVIQVSTCANAIQIKCKRGYGLHIKIDRVCDFGFIRQKVLQALNYIFFLLQLFI